MNIKDLMPMTTIYDIDTDKLIKVASKELKNSGLVKTPDWHVLVKTGVHKERPPTDIDWWYSRAAAILRKVYIKGPIGVSKLRTLYGGRKNRGFKPERFRKGSGKIIRTVLQQLEKSELIKRSDKDVHKGRIITKKGKSFLNNIAKSIK